MKYFLRTSIIMLTIVSLKAYEEPFGGSEICQRGTFDRAHDYEEAAHQEGFEKFKTALGSKVAPLKTSRGARLAKIAQRKGQAILNAGENMPALEKYIPGPSGEIESSELKAPSAEQLKAAFDDAKEGFKSSGFAHYGRPVAESAQRMGKKIKEKAQQMMTSFDELKQRKGREVSLSEHMQNILKGKEYVTPQMAAQIAQISKKEDKKVEKVLSGRNLTFATVSKNVKHALEEFAKKLKLNVAGTWLSKRFNDAYNAAAGLSVKEKALQAYDYLKYELYYRYLVESQRAKELRMVYEREENAERVSQEHAVARRERLDAYKRAYGSRDKYGHSIPVEQGGEFEATDIPSYSDPIDQLLTEEGAFGAEDISPARVKEQLNHVKNQSQLIRWLESVLKRVKEVDYKGMARSALQAVKNVPGNFQDMGRAALEWYRRTMARRAHISDYERAYQEVTPAQEAREHKKAHEQVVKAYGKAYPAQKGLLNRMKNRAKGLFGTNLVESDRLRAYENSLNTKDMSPEEQLVESYNARLQRQKAYEGYEPGPAPEMPIESAPVLPRKIEGLANVEEESQEPSINLGQSLPEFKKALEQAVQQESKKEETSQEAA